MAKRAETLRKPRSGWGRASHVVRGSVLAISLVAGASSLLQAEPLEADTAHANPLTPFAAERDATTPSTGQTTAGQPLSMSVSAFSAAQSDTARVLLAQELGGESNRAVGVRSVPTTPEAGAADNRGEAQVRQSEDAEARAEAEAVIVGRSLRAFTRDQEEADSSTPRRRASFSSAISRAAAAGALTSTNPNASVGSALNSSRFTPASNGGQFDPGFSQAAEVFSVVPGLRLESATIFGGYSSNSVPRGLLGGSGIARGAELGADYDLGASAVISYSHDGRRSLTQFTYSPSHVQRSRIPEWSTTDHRFSFRSSRDLTPRLSLQGTANAGNSGLEQFWIRPSVIRQIDAPASFNELMQRVLAGEISNDEFASLLTGSPVVDDPGGQERDLGRIFSMSAGTSASYAYSRRLTFNVGGVTSSNHVFGNGPETSSLGSHYVTSARTSRANASANYRMSSRTRISLAHTTAFSNSTFINSRSQSPSVSVTQTLSRHWNYGAGAGIGTISFDDNSSRYALSGTTTWTAHGSLGYVAGAHHVNLTAGKQVGDPMGFGGRSTVQANLSWGWQPRFSPWAANAGIAFSRTDIGLGSQLSPDFSSDLYSAGVSRRLTASTTFSTDYYYGDYISPYTGVAANMSLHRLQMSLMWRPVEQR